MKAEPFPEGGAGQLSHGPSRAVRLTGEGGLGFLIPRTGDGMRCQGGVLTQLKTAVTALGLATSGT